VVSSLLLEPCPASMRPWASFPVLACRALPAFSFRWRGVARRWPGPWNPSSSSGGGCLGVRAERQADDDQDERSPVAGEHDADDGTQRRRETLANPLTPTTPVRGYMPADEAMTTAAEVNRAYRRGLSRR
jgi:hypothetical protein